MGRGTCRLICTDFKRSKHTAVVKVGAKIGSYNTMENGNLDAIRPSHFHFWVSICEYCVSTITKELL